MISYLLQQLHRLASEEPGRIALTFLDEGPARTLTFGELERESARIAQRLATEVPHARRALLLHRPGPEFAAALCACWMAGVTPIPTYAPSYRLGSRASGRFERLVADADPQVILVDAASMGRVWQSATVGGLVGPRWMASDAPPRANDTSALAQASAVPDNTGPDGSPPALIQYTSGSTGTPRGVCLSHTNLEENLHAIARRFGLEGKHCIVSWLPPYHDMGLIGCVLPMLAFGCHLVQMAPSRFIQRPLRWLQAISEYRGDFSGGPNFAYELCARKIAPDALAGLDLSGWQGAFCGAETIRPGTLERFTALAAQAGFRASSLLPCYGLAEATLMVSATPLQTGMTVHAQTDAEGALAHRVRCGPPADGVALAIVDAQQRPCAEGTAGEIWIAGPAVAAGYWRKPEVNAQVFGQCLAGEVHRNARASDDQRAHEDPQESDPHDTAHGVARWLRSGDVGYLDQGELVVTGRLKDMVILRGRNFYPADIEEAAAASHPAIEATGVAAFGVDDLCVTQGDTDGGSEALVLACELRRERRHTDPAQIERAIQSALGEALDIRAGRIVLLRPGTLPRTTSGKISRSGARRAWLQGAMKEVPAKAAGGEGMPAHAPALAGVPSPLVACAARLSGLPIEQIDLDCTLGELGIDSLRQVELMLTLEHEFGIALSTDQIPPGLRLRELEALLASPQAAGKPAGAGSTPATLQAEHGSLPPSAQQLAYLEAGVERPNDFLETIYLRVPPALDRDALAAAFDWIAQRHPAVRLRFVREQGAWQGLLRPASGAVAVERLGSADAGRDAASWRAAMLQRVQQAIDIERGALAHAVWLDRGPLENGMLVIALHHLVVDAVSASILVTELQQAYRLCAAGTVLAPARPDGYVGWLQAQHACARDANWLQHELDCWQRICGPARVPTATSHLPGEGAWQCRLAPEQNRRFLARFADSAARCDAVLAAYTHAWSAISGEPSVLVRMEHHGRSNRFSRGATGAIGWLISFYPVRVDVADHDPGTHYEATRTAHAAVPGQGAGYTLLRHGAVPEAARAAMRQLQAPWLGMTYRGGVDEGFRRDDVFPVLGVGHLGTAWSEACARNGTLPAVELQASLVGGALTCSLFFQPQNIERERVRRIGEALEAFLLRLLA